jgi:hypothetical protein
VNFFFFLNFFVIFFSQFFFFKFFLNIALELPELDPMLSAVQWTPGAHGPVYRPGQTDVGRRIACECIPVDSG